MLIIETKEQLKQAIKENQKEFTVVGGLATQVSKAIKMLSATLRMGGALNPFTRRPSALTSELTVSPDQLAAIASIIAVSLGGIAVIYALYKEYNIEYQVKEGEVSGIKFTQKKSDEKETEESSEAKFTQR